MGGCFVPDYILHPLIIPTVLIPLTALSVALSVAATFIAGLFGIQLKAEGPKKLLEVLLKPKILLSALALNLLVLFSVHAFRYVKTLPSFEWTIQYKQKKLAQASTRNYTDSYYQAPLHYQEVSSARDGNSTKPNQPVNIEEVWHSKLSEGSFRGAVASGSSLFIGTADGYLFELDLETGKEIRKFFIGTYVSPAATIFKGSVYIGEGVHDTHHARIYKYNLASGNYEGSYETKGHTEGQAVLGLFADTPLLFAVAGSDGLHAFDPKTMKRRWANNIGHTDAAVAVSDGLVFNASGREKSDGNKYRAWATAFDFLNGEIKWQRELPASSWMPPVVHNDLACFIFGEVYFESQLGGFACFNKINGQSKASYFHKIPVAADPVILGDDIIVVDYTSQICRVSLTTGVPRWCQSTKETKSNMANAIYDPSLDLLVFATQEAGLFGLNPQTGALEFSELKPKNISGVTEDWKTTYAPLTQANEFWIAVDMSGNVRAYRAKRNSAN